MYLFIIYLFIYMGRGIFSFEGSSSNLTFIYLYTTTHWDHFFKELLQPIWLNGVLDEYVLRNKNK